MTTLDELRERLEKAEGPDRGLDLDILEVFDPDRHNKIYWGARASCNRDWPVERRDEYVRRLMLSGGHPNYTSSLDAAIALVGAKLPWWKRQMQEMPNGTFRYWVSYDSATAPSEHKSEPIALLLALLSALEKESAE